MIAEINIIISAFIFLVSIKTYVNAVPYIDDGYAENAVDRNLANRIPTADDLAELWIQSNLNQTNGNRYDLYQNGKPKIFRDSFRFGNYWMVKTYCIISNDNRNCMEVGRHPDKESNIPVKIRLLANPKVIKKTKGFQKEEEKGGIVLKHEKPYYNKSGNEVDEIFDEDNDKFEYDETSYKNKDSEEMQTKYHNRSRDNTRLGGNDESLDIAKLEREKTNSTDSNTYKIRNKVRNGVYRSHHRKLDDEDDFEEINYSLHGIRIKRYVKASSSSGSKDYSSSGSKDSSRGSKDHSSRGSKDHSSSGNKDYSSSGSKDYSSGGSKDHFAVESEDYASSKSKDHSASYDANSGREKGDFLDSNPSRSFEGSLIKGSTEDAPYLWNNCRLPNEAKNAEIACTKWNTAIACNMFCAHGYRFEEGLIRKTACKFSEGKWSKKFAECQPFIDCTLELVSAGILSCTTHHLHKGTSCTISCEHGKEEGTKSRKYRCESEGRWSPSLPHCVKKEGIDVLEPPEQGKVLKPDQISYPEKYPF